MSPDIHALTGAYVLDALSDEERVEFERHLDRCETCAEEVVELRETATRLALGAAEAAPPNLRSSVLHHITEVRQQSPVVESLPVRARTSLTQRLFTTAAAVLLVVATTFGVLLVRAQQDTDDLRQQADAMASVLRAEDAQVVRQDGITLVVSDALNQGVMFTAGLAEPPPDHDLQVWVMGAHTRSAGLVDPVDGRVSLAMHGVRDADQIGITIEPDGGSRAPTTESVLLVDVP